MKTPTIIAVLVAGLMLTGCEPCRHYNRLQVAAFTGGHVTRKPYGTVTAVFQRPEDVKRPYKIIAMLSCEGSIGEEAGILNAMLFHAADLGGDGVLLGVPRVAAEKTAAPDANDATTSVNVNAGWGVLINGNHRAYRCQVIQFAGQ